MLRTQIVKLARATPIQARAFSSVAARAAEGDTGGTRFGGKAQGDAFQKREEASEALYIREKERESLRKLKEKLQAQRKHLDELEQHIDELHKGSGGEQH